MDCKKEWKELHAKLQNTFDTVKLLHGRAWVRKQRTPDYELTFESKHGYLFKITKDETRILLGTILYDDEWEWCVVLRAGAFIECKYLSNFSVSGPGSATVIRTHKRAYVPDADSHN